MYYDKIIQPFQPGKTKTSGKGYIRYADGLVVEDGDMVRLFSGSDILIVEMFDDLVFYNFKSGKRLRARDRMWCGSAGHLSTYFELIRRTKGDNKTLKKGDIVFHGAKRRDFIIKETDGDFLVLNRIWRRDLKTYDIGNRDLYCQKNEIEHVVLPIEARGIEEAKERVMHLLIPPSEEEIRFEMGWNPKPELTTAEAQQTNTKLYNNGDGASKSAVYSISKKLADLFIAQAKSFFDPDNPFFCTKESDLEGYVKAHKGEMLLSLKSQDTAKAIDRCWPTGKTLKEQRDLARWRPDDYTLNRNPPKHPCPFCHRSTGCMCPRINLSE